MAAIGGLFFRRYVPGALYPHSVGGCAGLASCYHQQKTGYIPL